jgi:hypothetical protein
MNQNMLDPVISIGTLANKVGLSVSAIRKYEEEGLIIPHRSESGHRMFSYEDISRIQTIQHMVKNLGFNFEGIRRLQALLPCWNLLPCKKSERNACSAFKDNSKPCWMLKDAHCSLQGNECRLCDIYRFGSLNSEYIKEFLYDHNSRGDRTEILRNIQQKINKRE